MTVLQQVQADYNNTNPKEIEMQLLDALGYKLGNRYLAIGDPPSFKLHEILELDDKKTVSFSFLFHIVRNTGFIMPRKFEDYQQMYKKDVEAKQ